MAPQHPAVKYILSTAESSTIDSLSIDLVTVGTALHWFDFDSFFKELKRVLKPDGFFAAWGYGLPGVNRE